MLLLAALLLVGTGLFLAGALLFAGAMQPQHRRVGLLLVGVGVGLQLVFLARVIWLSL